MKQRSSQTCDTYMSQLRLSLPECKYWNDSDELLKDQFIFSLYNKEIQDHLLREISESDNSVKALYEARKVESKLAQRKMLGIVTPSALSVEAVRKGFKTHSHSHSNTHTHTDFSNCKFCGKAHNKKECPAYGKVCNRCGQKNHFESKCRSSQRSNSERSGRTKGKFSQKCDKCGHSKKVDCIEYSHGLW